MGYIMVEKIIKIVIIVVEEYEWKGQFCFEGFCVFVFVVELLDSGVISYEFYQQLQWGECFVWEVVEVDSVRQVLWGINVIVGVWLEEVGQKLSIYEVLKKDLLQLEVVVVLLEVQVGIGYIIDFVISVRLIVDEVVCVGLVGFELYEKLLLVEKVVIGYRDFYLGQSVLLFQVLKKGFIF